MATEPSIGRDSGARWRGAIQFVVTAVLAALGGVVAFSQASVALGGGVEGSFAAVLVVVIIALVSFFYYRRWNSHSPPLQPVPGHTEVPTPEPTPPVRERTVRSFQPRSSENLESEPVPRSACASGPYLVEPYSRRYVALRVRKGDLLSGTIIEHDGQVFDWAIVNDRNLAKAFGSERYTCLQGAEGVEGAVHLRWKVKHADQLFLLLDESRKQYPRTFSIELQATSLD